MKRASRRAEHWRDYLKNLGVDLGAREGMPRDVVTLNVTQAKWPSSEGYLPADVVSIPHKGTVR